MQENDALVVKTIFHLQDDCLLIVKEIKEVLLKERKALIGLDTDAVAETNAKKDHLGGLLRNRKLKLWTLLKHQYEITDTEGLEEKLGEENRKIWLTKKSEWLKNWDETVVLMERNQKFLKHSLKNFDMLVDNLKRLLGDQPLYSAKGQRVDRSAQGRMVQGKY